MADDTLNNDAKRRSSGPHAPLPSAGLGADQRPTSDVFKMEGTPERTTRAEKDYEDPRARAARRAAELRGHLGSALDDDGINEFYIDPRIIPDGWSYEYKRVTVLGSQDPSYQVALAMKGWEPVPAYRHPELMPQGYAGSTIERHGMILMERPAEITEEAKARDLQKALAQVNQKEQQLRGAPAGENSPFQGHNKGNSLVKMGKSYEMPIAEK